MKISLLQLSFIELAIIFIFTSCTIEKRVYMSGYHMVWEKWKQTSDRQELSDRRNRTIEEQNKMQSSEVLNSNDETVTASTNNSIEFLATNVFFKKYKLIDGNFTNPHKINFIPPKTSKECDTIIFRNGQKRKAEILEVGQNEIKYKWCGNINDSVFSMSKSEVFGISYPDGTRTVFTIDGKTYSNHTSSTNPVSSVDTREIEPNALFGCISSVAGPLFLFVFTSLVFAFPLNFAIILLGPATVILSAIGLSQINKYPKRFKGKGWAQAGLALGIIEIIFVVLLSIALLTLSFPTFVI